MIIASCLLQGLLLTACGGGGGASADTGAVATVAAVASPAPEVAASTADNSPVVDTAARADTSQTVQDTQSASTQDSAAAVSVPVDVNTLVGTTTDTVVAVNTPEVPATTAGAASGTLDSGTLVDTQAVNAVSTPAAAMAPTVLATTLALNTATDLAAINKAAWPFSQPALATLRASAKKVFAHYFVPFPISIDNRTPDSDYYSVNYLSPSGEGGKFAGSGGFIKQRPLPRPVVASATWDQTDVAQDVRRAAALGIDGFAVDLLETTGANWARAVRLMDVANSIDTGFKVMLMPDMEAEFKQKPGNLLPALRILARHPAAYRLADGRLVVSPYNAQNQNVAWWKSLLATLKAEGIDVAFFPVFQGWSGYAPTYAAISYGMSDWGDRSPTVNRSGIFTPSRVHAYGTKWMAPVSPQDARPKDFIYWEARNSENYRVMWENAIRGGADWVQIITWNDYSESTEVAPSSGTQWSFYDLTAYYTTWFKTGTMPAVNRDMLMYFHRKHSTAAAANLAKQTRPYGRVTGSDTAANDVEVLAFATAASTLELTVGGKTTTQSVAAGMTSVRVPLAEGTPSFRLLRGGAAVATVMSGFPINNSITYQDLLYRSGSSTRALVNPR